MNEEIEEKYKKAGRNYDNLHTYIYRLLKNLNLRLNMSNECKDILNLLILNVASNIVELAVKLTRYSKKQTITADTIKTSLGLLLGDCKEICDFCEKAVNKYNNDKTKNITKAKRSDLILPPPRFKHILDSHKYAQQQIGVSSYIFLTASLEFFLSSLLSQAIEYLIEDNKITMNINYIYKGLQHQNLNIYQPFFKNVLLGCNGNGNLDIYMFT